MERFTHGHEDGTQVHVPASLAPYVASVAAARTRAGDRWVALPSAWFRLSVSLSGDDATPEVHLTLSGLHPTPGVFRMERSGREVVALLTLRGAVDVFGCPLGATAQRRVPVADLLGARAAADLAARISGSASPAQALVSWIGERAANDSKRTLVERRVTDLAEALAGTSPARTITVAELARVHAVSRRQLERDFNEWTGVAPAAFRRLVRFQRAAREIVAGRSLATAALRAGYADQSHMTNAMRGFALVTPRGLANGAQRALEALADGRMLFLSPDALPQGPAIEALPAACPFTRLRRRING